MSSFFGIPTNKTIVRNDRRMHNATTSTNLSCPKANIANKTPIVGSIILNSVDNSLYYGDGTQWTILGSGSGSVSLINTGTGLTGGPITNTGTISLVVPVDVVNGGTGFTSYTTGDLIYASGATTLSQLSIGASDTVLLGGIAPSWGKVDLTSAVTGTLPVGNGGTGTNTLSGDRVMLSNTGGTAIIESTSLTDGQLVIGSTGNTPSIATLTSGSGVSIVNGAGSITISATGSGGTVTSIGSGTSGAESGSSGLTFSADPITSTGTIALSNTSVTPTSYTHTNLTVDQQGRITTATTGQTLNVGAGEPLVRTTTGSDHEVRSLDAGDGITLSTPVAPGDTIVTITANEMVFNEQIFDDNSGSPFAIPSDAISPTVSITAGGGGGGCSAQDVDNAGGGGGGSGSQLIDFPLSPGDNVIYSLGAGGLGTLPSSPTEGNDGDPGGNSTIQINSGSILTLQGGSGGQGAPTLTTPGLGGSGGTPSIPTGYISAFSFNGADGGQGGAEDNIPPPTNGGSTYGSFVGGNLGPTYSGAALHGGSGGGGGSFLGNGGDGQFFIDDGAGGDLEIPSTQGQRGGGGGGGSGDTSSQGANGGSGAIRFKWWSRT